MPLNFQGFLQGASGAGSAGFALSGGNPLIAGGAALLGGIWVCLSKARMIFVSRRLNDLETYIANAKAGALANATSLINTGRTSLISQTGGMQSNNLAAAKRRAIAEGRPNDVSSIANPGTQQIATGASNALTSYNQASNQQLFDIGNQYDQEATQAQMGFADRPIQPSVSDTLLTAGTTAANTAIQYQGLQAYKNYLGTNPPMGGGGGTYNPNTVVPSYGGYNYNGYNYPYR